MKNKIVNELITAMKARVPEKQNLAGYLADTLCMGKEAEIGRASCRERVSSPV